MVERFPRNCVRAVGRVRAAFLAEKPHTPPGRGGYTNGETALTVLLSLVLLMLPGLRPQTPTPTLPPTLHYVAHWRLLPAGTATLDWSQTGAERQIHFTANASDLVDLFYPVHDVMVSTYDPATFCTSSAVNNTIEGRRHRLTKIEFQPGQHQLILDESDPGGAAASKHQVKPIPGCVADLLTALDYIRAQPLRVGDVYSFRVNEGGKTSDVRCTVDLRETITTPAGRFATVRVHPALIGGNQKLGELWVWFSDDARHLPVQIQTHAFWGTLTAQLTK